MTQKYIRPPVVEAVIEVTFSTPTQAEDRERLRAKVARQFPISEELIDVEFQFKAEVGGKAEVRQSANGFKLTSGDATQIVQITKNTFSLSQLAPYEGWDAFMAAFEAAYRPAKKIFGSKSITRVGMRYINRIDVKEKNAYLTEKYLNVTLTMPNSIAPSVNYSVIYETMIGERPSTLRVTSGSAESPLLDHTALVLDIDVVAAVDLPKFDGDIWAVLDELRRHKNDVFEMTITENTRALIGTRG